MTNTTHTSPAILLDENGICINGEYKVLLASSLFYFRQPRERWESRMQLLKAAGYNAIDVYFPWNFHETAPGCWDFTGQRDVSAFLALAAKHQLYVIARPGPYICSEWDGGAIPAWLWAQEVPVRQDHPEFLAQIGAWYEHILPLIAPFQITRDGTVICMQIENELDFFDCKSPVSYMEKLMHKAASLGIDVPLFYCCGQNDLLRGGGLTPHLHTAFNVYTSADNAGLEERALYLYGAARKRGMPFLVTETNREHSFLKRLLACGAKLISPYNQTAGSTLDWYNGITNWGPKDSPLSLMATDYDFQSMIGSAGEINGEFYQARLLAGMLHSLGESLACAVPSACDEYVTTESADLPCYALECDRGKLLCVSNLNGHRHLGIELQGQAYPLSVPPLQTKLLPCGVILSHHFQAVLAGSNYEIAYIEETPDSLTVALYGEGNFSASLTLQGQAIQITASPKEEIITHQYGPVRVLIGSTERMALSHIPGLPDLHRSITHQETRREISCLETAPCLLPAGPAIETPILPMEKLGQYRGIGCYRFVLKAPGRILFQNVADIFTLYKDGSLAETGYSEGGCLERDLGAGTYDLYTEIWGHSNFDDIRRPSLHMGSLKGLSGLIRIEGSMDISENWAFDLDQQPVQDWYFFRHSDLGAIASIDSYNRACTPFRGVYDKWIDIPSNANALYLHVTKCDCVVHVYGNGQLLGTVNPADPYMDLSRFCGSSRTELCLRVERRYFSDEVGQVLLLWGQKIDRCTYHSVPIETITSPSDTSSAALPFSCPCDSHLLLKVSLPQAPQKEYKLRLEGRDVKLTFLLNQRVVGRLVLGCDRFPVVAGGDPHVVHLCREWLTDSDLLIWCQPIGNHPQIDRIEMIGYDSILE